ncbi:unnamed protein product [Penicillium salamii]|uniref:NAD(P)-binding protein n=1 Tax=Penicillium salamii TaxID=1612424 RepID=A0A9W4J4N7_9EURO|nr:unnamed protein product [Penicillium salamii]CAG8032591.1 unnamed protein product [Penicillium salamii]CAG8058944.1 unnamed protein product [Penicillium salamii]CAG8110379.1 unnamed protein product [Penicillium salamii]CAG8179505.1 unnamed protein product [Penicillium salamii]
MAAPITLVVGASRGIGYELVRQLGQDPTETVVGALRNPESFQPPHDHVKYLPLDLTNSESITKAAANIEELDTLIINGAIGDDERLTSITTTRLSDYLDTNVVGPLRVAQSFIPALFRRQTRKIIFISSYCGSFGVQVNNLCGWGGPYAVSKAAENMLALQLHHELKKDDFTVIPIHPGNVATDMGNIGGGGGTPVDEAVGRILTVIRTAAQKDSAKFFSHDGSILPW